MSQGDREGRPGLDQYNIILLCHLHIYAYV